MIYDLHRAENNLFVSLYGLTPREQPRGESRLELGVHVFGIMWNYFVLSYIVFYLEMKVEVELGVHDIRSRFTPLVQRLCNLIMFAQFTQKTFNKIT